MRRQQRRQRLAGARRLARRHLLRRAARSQPPVVFAGFLPEIDDGARRSDRVEEAPIVRAALDLAKLAGELHSMILAAGEERGAVLDGEAEHLGDVLALVSHLERVLVVLRAVADGADALDVGRDA